MFEKFIAIFIGKKIVEKLDLQEGTVMETKVWYKSRTLWIAIITVVLGGTQSISAALGHPIVIPSIVYQVLTALGLYTARTADTTIVASK